MLHKYSYIRATKRQKIKEFHREVQHLRKYGGCMRRVRISDTGKVREQKRK